MMPFYLKQITANSTTNRLDDWAFKVFVLSTIFIVFFATNAIHNWPPFLEKLSILLVCLLPAGMVVHSQIPIWHKAKQIPKEVLWVALLFILGIISSILSENIWASMKSMVLFMVSGPLVFISTRYLFESTKNQEIFLWITSLGSLFFGLLGNFEHNYSYSLELFSGNPLAAGTLLILLLSGPIILLSRKNSTTLRFLLILSVASSILAIILLSKKGPFLALVIIFLLLAIFANPKCWMFLLGFILLTGAVLYFSEPTLSKYKSRLQDIKLSSFFHNSVNIRLENYFFGLHTFNKNPVWGVGFKANIATYLEDYDIHFSDKILKSNYREYIQNEKTFENIIVTFLVELGSVFCLVYFGGVLYVFTKSFKNSRSPPNKGLPRVYILSILIGFVAISLTFDTLRFPNLNWAFHCLLGLMANSAKLSSQ